MSAPINGTIISSSLTSSDMISPAAYATLFTLSSIVLVLVISTACYNLLRSRPSTSLNNDPEQGLFSPRKPADFMDDHSLEAYPRMSFSQANNSSCCDDNKLCSICLGEYEEDDLVLLLPNCRHFFHVHCVHRWLRLRATCPICRNSSVASVQDL